MLVTSHTTLGISRSKVAIYMAVTILCSVIEGLAWNLTIMKWFGMALSNYDAPSMEHQLGMLLFYIAAGLAVSFAIVLFHSSKEVKIKK